MNICEAYATTPQDFLWHNISTSPVTVLQCPGARYAFASRFRDLLQTTGNEANYSAGERAAGWT